MRFQHQNDQRVHTIKPFIANSTQFTHVHIHTRFQYKIYFKRIRHDI